MSPVFLLLPLLYLLPSQSQDPDVIDKLEYLSRAETNRGERCSDMRVPNAPWRAPVRKPGVTTHFLHQQGWVGVGMGEWPSPRSVAVGKRGCGSSNLARSPLFIDPFYVLAKKIVLGTSCESRCQNLSP